MLNKKGFTLGSTLILIIALWLLTFIIPAWFAAQARQRVRNTAFTTAVNLENWLEDREAGRDLNNFRHGQYFNSKYWPTKEWAIRYIQHQKNREKDVSEYNRSKTLFTEGSCVGDENGASIGIEYVSENRFLVTSCNQKGKLMERILVPDDLP